jgi:hypothetical protein
MTRAGRYAFFGLAWAFVIGVLAQVFFIGLGLFADPGAVALHVNFGWILHLAPILILIAAAVARAGRGSIGLAAALAVVVFVVPVLPAMREGTPVVAALHPVLAIVAFALSVAVALRATAVAFAPAPDDERRVEQATAAR